MRRDHPGRGERQLGRAAEQGLAVRDRQQVGAELVDLGEQARPATTTRGRARRRSPRRRSRSRAPRARRAAGACASRRSRRAPGRRGAAFGARRATGRSSRRRGSVDERECGRRARRRSRARRSRPRVSSATNEGATAMPLASVFDADRSAPCRAKRPLAPSRGAENVTTTPATGLPFLSVTVTASRIGKRVPTVGRLGRRRARR